MDVTIIGTGNMARVENGGLRAVDAGPLRRAHQLEALGYLHIALQEQLGTGYASAVKILG
jgi:8-hydroxy-5-deazaflavin:NADPH oxidoreductase